MRNVHWISLAVTVNRIWYARNQMWSDKKPLVVKEIIKNIQTDVYQVLFSLFPPEVVVSHMDCNINLHS